MKKHLKTLHKLFSTLVFVIIFVFASKNGLSSFYNMNSVQQSMLDSSTFIRIQIFHNTNLDLSDEL